MKRQRRSRRIPNCVRWIASASARRATACAMDLTVGGSRGLVLSPRRKERQGWCEAVRFVHSACGMREKSSVYQADPFLKKTPASTRPATIKTRKPTARRRYNGGLLEGQQPAPS